TAPPGSPRARGLAKPASPVARTAARADSCARDSSFGALPGPEPGSTLAVAVVTSSRLLSRSFGYAASSWLTLVDGTEAEDALAPSRAERTTSFQPMRFAKFASRNSRRPEPAGAA